MSKNKFLVLIIVIFIAVIIGEAIFFNLKLKAERVKTKAYVQENFSKGIANVSVLVKIKQETPEGQYNDSLYYPIEKWSTLTSEEIKADIQARVDKWINTVRTPAQE